VAADLLKRHPEIQAVEWVPRVRASEREAMETTARQQGVQDFQFTEPSETGSMARAADRAEYWPLYFVEPLEGNEVVLGWDTLAGPNREVMEHARDTGELCGTGKVRIRQNIGGKSAWILALPLYAVDLPSLTLEERRQTLRGFLRVVFRLEDLFDPTSESVPPAGLEIQIYDKTPGVKNTLFYSYPSTLRSKALTLASETGFLRGVHHRKVLNVAGRQLWFYHRPAPEWAGSQSSWIPESLLAVGLLGAILLRFILSLVGRGAEATEEKVAERTSSLTLANDLLKKEVAERKHAEELLRRTHASLVEAQRIGHIGSWELDLIKDTLSWSEETYRIFGLNPEQFTPTPAARQSATHRDDMERVQAEFAEALHAVKLYRSEHRIMRPDGSERAVLEKAEIIVDAQGQPVQMIGTVEDITEHKQAENERLRMERKLQETQKLESLG
jgi:PAS domain S-box-containing protein